jgi:hypothetical protein
MCSVKYHNSIGMLVALSYCAYVAYLNTIWSMLALFCLEMSMLFLSLVPHVRLVKGIQCDGSWFENKHAVSCSNLRVCLVWLWLWKKLLWAVSCENSCRGLWTVRNLKFVWLETVIKLYRAIKRLNFGIMSSPHGLKFDLVFYYIFSDFLWIFKKFKLKIEKCKFE